MPTRGFERCERATIAVSPRARAQSVLDEYATTNYAEFFAVATEVFFERPTQLKNEDAALYEQLAALFHQDPAAGLVSLGYFGKITGNTMSVVKMQRSLCPHSGTMIALCLAPSVSVTYLKNASPRARRVGPCAIAVGDESKPPSGSTSTWPSRYVVGRSTSCFFS